VYRHETSGGVCKPAKSPVITLAAYSTPYDAYGKLISTWQKEWAAAHNKQQVIFQTSFGGSTTQAENVASGFPADIVALSLVPDVQIIQKAGLITHDFTKDPDGSIVSTTPVAFDVRPGNPKHIRNWNDLTRPGLQILTRTRRRAAGPSGTSWPPTAPRYGARCLATPPAARAAPRSC
jgi:sulfate/thiosulfate transport system substrate-binding protein